MTDQNRILEFNFIKAVSAIGIVIFHFAGEAQSPELLPGNYDWGGIFVTIFFMVSGSLLYYNYREPRNLKVFYYKRWKALMPAFYTAFLCVYALQVIKNGSLFYNGRPASLLLTLIGQDGYLLPFIPNYYLLGEWFLGAILLLYVLYPLLARMLDKKEWLVFAAVVVLYLLSLAETLPYGGDFRSVFSCLFSFTLGIVIEKHKLYRYRWLAVPAFLCFIAESALPAGRDGNLSTHADGILLFFVLFALGSLVYRSGPLGRASDFLSRISYDIFLIHHVLLIQFLKVLRALSPFDTLPLHLFGLLATLVLVLVTAAVFSKIIDFLMSRKVLLRFDKWVLQKIQD